MRPLHSGGLPLVSRRWPCLLLVLAVLAGCGGGVGGTGTGPSSVVPPVTGPGTPPLLCESALSPLLNCPAAGSPAAAQGTGLVWLADNASAPQTVVRLQGQSLGLELACSGWRFDGHWSPGATPETALRFAGELRPLAGGEPQPGSLVLQPVAGGVRLQLLDARDGAIGPAESVVVVATPPPLAACTR